MMYIKNSFQTCFLTFGNLAMMMQHRSYTMRPKKLFFSLITILSAPVGMFGLVAFTTKSRAKEVGIRKIHGASASQIFGLLAREFVVLIIIAILLSWPTGIVFKSIDPAAYKAETELWEYLFTGGLVLLIAFFTISYHTQKVSKQNPTEALRYE